MTALPQLVAAFHSLVGLAAVLVAGAAFTNPEAYHIGTPGNIHGGSLVEMSLGLAIGAITFTGSIVAFAKLQGLVTGKPLVFPLQHPFNAALGILLVALIVWFVIGSSSTRPSSLITAVVAAARLPAHPADRRRRHAGGDLDAQQLFGLGRLRHRLHACRTRC